MVMMNLNVVIILNGKLRVPTLCSDESYTSYYFNLIRYGLRQKMSLFDKFHSVVVRAECESAPFLFCHFTKLNAVLSDTGS